MKVVCSCKNRGGTGRCGSMMGKITTCTCVYVRGRGEVKVHVHVVCVAAEQREVQEGGGGELGGVAV